MQALAPLVQRKTVVLDLADVDGGMLPLVGGKAANLGELIRAGLPVPPGVCVTTEAYKQIAAFAPINFDVLEGAAHEDLKQCAWQAREALMSAPLLWLSSGQSARHTPGPTQRHHGNGPGAVGFLRPDP